MTTHAVVGSPVGPLTLLEQDGVRVGLYMLGQRHRPDPALDGARDDRILASVTGAARRLLGRVAALVRRPPRSPRDAVPLVRLLADRSERISRSRSRSASTPAAPLARGSISTNAGTRRPTAPRCVS